MFSADETLRDPWGNVIARQVAQGGERERVCEVVTTPLADVSALHTILQTAVEHGFTVPAEAACHVHYDADGWDLRKLIVAYDHERKALLARVKPNPRCRKLGPFPEVAVRVACEAPADMPAATLHAALDMAIPSKGFDINILGLVQQHARQRTLELRCLPMLLDADALLERVAIMEAFLATVRE